MAEYKVVKVPKDGAKITMGANKQLQVPDNPIIPLSKATAPAAISGALPCACSMRPWKRLTRAKRKSTGWKFTPGEKSFKQYNSWLHEETVPAFTEFLVGIKGPLTTPIGGGMTSLNVGLRKLLDLYVCQRPVRYFNGVPSPVKHPEYVDMVGFPRKHRRYLHRHRVSQRHRSQCQIQIAAQRKLSKRICQDSLSKHGCHRFEAGLGRRHRASGARGDSVGAEEQA